LKSGKKRKIRSNGLYLTTIVKRYICRIWIHRASISID